MADLYNVKQHYVLGAFKTLVKLPLPDPNDANYTTILLYQVRAHLALGDTASAKKLIPKSSENVALKSAAALVKFIESTDKDGALEELRDLSVEIEGDDVDGTEQDKATVRVLAGTAFARAGEIEEALETLGADTEDLEAVAVAVQIYLSINRPDLAKKEFDRSKSWAEDDLLLQLIESNIGLVTGKDNYSNTQSFYTEQLANPSFTSPHLLTARGVTRLLRNEVEAAKSDLEESLQQENGDIEAQLANLVANELTPVASWKDFAYKTKLDAAEQAFSKFASQHPSHPVVSDLEQKSALFDDAATKYVVPPPVNVSA